MKTMSQSNPDAEQGKPVVIIAGTSANVRRRRSGCGLLGVIVALLIVIALLGSVAVGVLALAAPNLLSNLVGGITGIQTLQTRAVPGTASSFDPISNFQAVREFAGPDAQFISLRASNVRSDGTLDLTATYSSAPRVEYNFAREIPRPADAPPVGAGGTGTGPWYEPITVEAYKPGQRSQISTVNGGVRVSFQHVNEGLTRSVSVASTGLADKLVDAPQCSFKNLWQTTLEANRKAQKDAVAIISYDSDGYDFVISGLGVSLQFDMDCRLKR
jgi:hypothetical protein